MNPVILWDRGHPAGHLGQHFGLPWAKTVTWLASYPNIMQGSKRARERAQKHDSVTHEERAAARGRLCPRRRRSTGQQ